MKSVGFFLKNIKLMRAKFAKALQSDDLRLTKRNEIPEPEDGIARQYFLYADFGNSKSIKRILDVLTIIKNDQQIDFHFTNNSVDVVFESESRGANRIYKYRIVVSLFGEKMVSYYNDISEFDKKIKESRRARLITISSKYMKKVIIDAQTKKFHLSFVGRRDRPDNLIIRVRDEMADITTDHLVPTIRSDLIEQERNLDIVAFSDTILAMTVGAYENLFARANPGDEIRLKMNPRYLSVSGEGELSWECERINIKHSSSDPEEGKQFDYVIAPTDGQIEVSVNKRNVFVHKKLLIILQSVWLCITRNPENEAKPIFSVRLNLIDGAGFCYFRQDY